MMTGSLPVEGRYNERSFLEWSCEWRCWKDQTPVAADLPLFYRILVHTLPLATFKYPSSLVRYRPEVAQQHPSAIIASSSASVK